MKMELWGMVCLFLLLPRQVCWAHFLDCLKCVPHSSHTLGGASSQEMKTLIFCFLGERFACKMAPPISLHTSD